MADEKRGYGQCGAAVRPRTMYVMKPSRKTEKLLDLEANADAGSRASPERRHRAGRAPTDRQLDSSTPEYCLSRTRPLWPPRRGLPLASEGKRVSRCPRSANRPARRLGRSASGIPSLPSVRASAARQNRGLSTASPQRCPLARIGTHAGVQDTQRHPSSFVRLRVRPQRGGGHRARRCQCP